MNGQDDVVRTIVAEVLDRLRPQLAGVSTAPPASPAPVGAGLRPARPGVSPARPSVGDGVFATVDEAVQAAAIAQTRLAALSLAERGRIVDIVRRVCDERAEELGAMELAETGIGRLDHKIEKLRIVKNVRRAG